MVKDIRSRWVRIVARKQRCSSPFAGRWVAQDGLDVLFDASSPEAVVQWLRRRGRRAVTFRTADFKLEVTPIDG